jgi:hypothetical protein
MNEYKNRHGIIIDKRPPVDSEIPTATSGLATTLASAPLPPASSSDETKICPDKSPLHLVPPVISSDTAKATVTSTSNTQKHPEESPASLPSKASSNNTQKLPEQSKMYAANKSATSESTTAAPSAVPHLVSTEIATSNPDSIDQLPEQPPIEAALEADASDFSTAAPSAAPPPATAFSQPSAESANSGDLQSSTQENPSFDRDNSDFEPERDTSDLEQENDQGDGYADA